MGSALLSVLKNAVQTLVQAFVMSDGSFAHMEKHCSCISLDAS